MCVATPMKVLSIRGPMARVSASGAELDVGIELVDDVVVGDYVIVHAGYAISRLEPAEAEETLALLERLNQIEAQMRAEAAGDATGAPPLSPGRGTGERSS